MNNPLKYLALCLLGVAVIAFSFTGANSEETAKTKPQSEKTINQLLEQQRKLLTQLVVVQAESYRAGTVDYEAVVHSHQQLLKVQLELTTDHIERIKLRREAMNLAADLQKFAAAKYRAGIGTQGDVLTSQSIRLGMEIDLLREHQQSQERVNP